MGSPGEEATDALCGSIFSLLLKGVGGSLLPSALSGAIRGKKEKTMIDTKKEAENEMGKQAATHWH